MEEALEMARSKDTKERMAGVERLYQLLEASRKSLSSSEVTSLVDCCLDLLKDNNFRVSQGALQALASAAVLSGEHFKLHFNALVPATVERLGDAKQPVRDAARRLLLTLMEVSSPTIIVERAGSYAWTHKSWRVREEFARTVTSAIGLFASTELPLQRAILPPEMYTQVGPQFRDELQRHHLPTSLVKDITARLERIEPKVHSSDGLPNNYTAVEVKPMNLNPKKSSPKAKNSTREVSLFGGDNDVTEKPIDPIKVYSEKELIREFEKISSTLVPDKDWSIRIGAMQRFEGLVIGGATDYPSFRGLLKQLVGPLSTQLSDRRSSIVKQACHLLCFLSKELLGDFEACAEAFIPVLFKLVVITVLVIAESADNCIKTMLRNCKVARVLPRIADCAKNDRNAVLRARCCEYALLILEYWADAPEIQRAADLYEDFIRCCVADAMSENSKYVTRVVDIGTSNCKRTCYRMFAKTWPDRSRRLFLSFDPVIQRVINDEDGGMHKRHASPSLRERSSQLSFTPQASAPSNIPGYGTSAIVAMDRSSSLSSGTSLSSGLLLSQAKPVGKGTERSLESVLHASKQKVTAIESMLRGLDASEKHNPSTLRSSSLDLGVDPPSSRDPPFPLAVPASNNLATSLGLDTTTSGMFKGNNRNGGLALSDIITQIQASKDASKLSYRSAAGAEPLSTLSSYSAKRASEKLQERGPSEANADGWEARRFMNLHADRQYLDTPYKDANVRDSQNNYIPNFQRPLLRKNVTGRLSASRRSFDDSQLSLGEISSYVEGPASLNDALSEGLSPSSDWNARVAAFNYLHTLLQQGPKGIQEVTQNFEKMFLLPALLRSLDEQRSPKAKLAVIEFAISSFNKHAMNSEGSGNSGILKLWLAKLTPLVHDKNTKLKEAAVTCIISVYSHFDSMAVLNFIVSLSVEEQNSLRRALKQYTPRIEVDLMNFLQNKKDRQRPKSSYDPSDVVGTSSEDGYIGVSRKNHLFGRYSGSSMDSDGARKWISTQEPTQVTGSIDQDASDENETQEHLYQGLGTSADSEVLIARPKDLMYTTSSIDGSVNMEASSTPRLDVNGLMNYDHQLVSAGFKHDNEALAELDLNHLKIATLKINSAPDMGLSIPQLLHQICNGNDESPTASKRSALQQLVDASIANDQSIWTKYFNQILTVILEVLDDSESSICELALSLIAEMLKNQKDAMEDSVEIVIEKLLHVTKDIIPKVVNEAELCLAIVLSQYDANRCLSVIFPLLVTEDEKTLVTCINCLTKLVGRLSQEELMPQLPSFLPALFEAFGNQSADVRKTVVFCLVDIYIMLGKAFLPYLEGLNSTQLRLVTIYANRISQARSGTALDVHHD
ncbi:CLIP-associated protein [Actinidia rufa]|uniref:CLIP-associated protein n=1 Tax=Actinidia rufa TaxID=165716 RepID=A0A7J0HAS2_9ERIC|nr:CLIP-associated protein [Actinidia rufa]